MNGTVTWVCLAGEFRQRDILTCLKGIWWRAVRTEGARRPSRQRNGDCGGLHTRKLGVKHSRKPTELEHYQSIAGAVGSYTRSHPRNATALYPLGVHANTHRIPKAAYLN